jgi:CheY-like chemotaxis protein
MQNDIKRGKIVFIDDDIRTINDFVAHLREEGFSHIVVLQTIKSLADVLRETPDLLFLDIAGVASNIDNSDEGIAVLRYVRRHAPWTRIVVLSGSTFEVGRAPDLAEADRCISKASLRLADLVEVTEQELEQSLSPASRNSRILAAINEQMGSLQLPWNKRRKLRRLLQDAAKHRGDANYDWEKLGRRTLAVLKGSAEVAGLAKHLLSS